MLYNTEYKLTRDNYSDFKNIKKRIVIGHTFNNNMKHISGWKHRLNKKYDKTAPFTISLDGSVYNHFDPAFSSNFLQNEKLDKSSIVILLENEGWLIKNEQKNLFFNVNWSIYSSEDIFIKKWRGYEYWAIYTQKQLESLVNLVIQLCNDFDIEKNIVEHNTKIDDVEYYNGILYHSNINKNYTDPSPAFDFREFRTRLIEKYKNRDGNKST